MIREIIVHELSYRDEAAYWFPVWHRAHDKFLYHIDTEPKACLY